MIATLESGDVVAVAIKSFWRIAERWQLSSHEAAILLGLDDTSADLTRVGDLTPVTPETLVRISHVLAIFKALHCLLPEPQADDWLRAANTGEPFGGAPALDRLLRGGMDDLVATRSYLDANLYR